MNAHTAEPADQLKVISLLLSTDRGLDSMGLTVLRRDLSSEEGYQSLDEVG